MAEPKSTNPFEIPGLTDTTDSLVDVSRKHQEAISAIRKEAKVAVEQQNAERAERVERGVKQATRPPQVEDDGDLTDDEAAEASSALDRYLAPVQAAARNLDSGHTVLDHKRQPAEPILGITDDEIAAKRTAGGQAFDVYRSLYDDVDGDIEKVRSAVYSRSDARVTALAVDNDAMEALTELVEDQTEPYSWSYRNVFKPLGATPDSDQESVDRLREEFSASRAARAMRLGPNQTAFTEQLSVLMPASIAEIDLGATQRELIDAYRKQGITDAAFHTGGKELTREDYDAIEAEAVRRATNDIEGAMSRMGTPRIYAMTADKTPYEMVQENREKGTARLTDGISLSILEAKLRPKYVSLPTDAGAADTALVYGTNGLTWLLGQVLMAIDPAEWIGTSAEVAKREYKRNIREYEEEDEEVDFSDVILAAGKAEAALHYSMILQQLPPLTTEVKDVVLSAIEPESMGQWRQQVIEDTIIAAGDNEDLFDAATGAIPTFVAAGNRALTGEDTEVETRKWFMEHQLAAKSVLFLGAVVTPSVPVFDALRGAGGALIPGARRVRAAPVDIATRIERDLADETATFDVDRLATDLQNAHGVGVGVLVRGVLQSAAANAAEKDAALLSRDVDRLFTTTREASARLIQTAESTAQAAGGARTAALDDVLQQADMDRQLVETLAASLQAEAITPGFRAMRDATDTATLTPEQAQAASRTWRVLEDWQQELATGNPQDVVGMQRLAQHMDAVLKETDETRDAVDAALHNIDIDIARVQGQLTQDVVDTVAEFSRAEKTLARGMSRLAEMKQANPTMARVIGGIELHAENLRRQAALEKRLRTIRQSGQSSDVVKPRAEVEARIQALTDLETAGTKLTRDQHAERLMLRSRLAATPAQDADVRVFSVEATRTMQMMRTNRKQIAQSSKALSDLQAANPKLHGQAKGIIDDMTAAALVLRDVDKATTVAATKTAQQTLRRLNNTKDTLVRMYGKLDAVDAFVVLKSRDKYRGIARRVRLKDSVLDEVSQRRGAAVIRAKKIAYRRAMARAQPADKEAMRVKLKELNTALNKAERTARSAATQAAVLRLRKVQRQALLDFAKSLRRGAAEVDKRKIQTRSLTYRTGRPDEDIAIIDRARNALDAALGAGNIFGKAVTNDQFADLVRRAVAAVQDDIIKNMDDLDDVNRVIEQYAPVIPPPAANALKTLDGRRALVGAVVNEWIELMWMTFSKNGNIVKVENLRQAVTEAVDVAMQMRRAERDLNATLAVQQTTWAQQGAMYALYKMLSPRTGFIGEGSEQAWRVFQHADQTSAGFQAWLVLSSKTAIDAISSSGKKYTRTELAALLVKTVSDAFDSTDALARLGLPVDVNTPFQVAKRFFTERTPSAHEPTLTPESSAVAATKEVVEINRELEELQARRAAHVRAHMENKVQAGRRKDALATDEAALLRVKNEHDALQKEVADNAAAAADAKVRQKEVQDALTAAEQLVIAPPPAVVSAMRTVEDDVMTRLTEEVADLKARVAAADKEVDDMIAAVAPVLTPRQRAERGAAVRLKRRELEVLKNQDQRLRKQWQKEQEAAIATKAALMGGDTTMPHPAVLARMQAELAEGKTPEQVVLAAIEEVRNYPWAPAMRVWHAVDPTQRSRTVGGFADTIKDDIDRMLRELETYPDKKDQWRRVAKKMDGWFNNLAAANADKPIGPRSIFLEKLDETKSILDARRVLNEWKKKAAAYQKVKADTIAEVMAHLRKVETTETFETSELFRKHQGAIFDLEREIERLVGTLDVTKRGKDARIQELKATRDKVAEELKGVYGRMSAQRARLKAIDTGNFGSVNSAIYKSHVTAQTAEVDRLKTQLQEITAQVGTYERFAKRDLTGLAKNVAAAEARVTAGKTALATADARAAASKAEAEAATAAMATKKTRREEIVARSAGLSPADVRTAMIEGAFDESKLSVFDKMILNMGRSVFRGIQAANMTSQEADRILYAVALNSIKKSNSFAELHESIKKGILARISGSKVIDERAPRTVNSLAAALIQGVVSEYTTQYALREGLALMDKKAAMAFNALMHREIGNSSGNGLHVIRDMYSTLEEVLRVGARVGRVSEGRSTVVGVERRTGVEMSLIEAAKLPGFAEGVWVPENVFKTALEDLESYARQMDVLVSTAPAEPFNWLMEKGKKVFSIWRTKTLVGYGINKLGYRTRAIFGDIGSTLMVLGPREAAKVAAVSLPNYIPFFREAAIKQVASLSQLPKKHLDSLAAMSNSLRAGTNPSRLLAPGTWSNLPRRSVAAMLDAVASVPRTLMGLAPVHVAGLLSGSPSTLLKIGDVEQTVAQWWQEMRVEGILDNNVQINLRTGLKQNTEIWADLTARRYSWAAVEREYWRRRKLEPDITREDVRQALEASDAARPLSILKRVKYALLRHQESLEKTEAEVHVTTRVALYASLRDRGLTAKEAADGVKAAVYDWNYGANRAALNALAFVPFGRFHLLRQKQGIEVMNLAGDTSPWRSAGGGTGAIRRAALLQRYMASTTGFEIPTEEELDTYLADARGYGMSMAESWGMTPAQAATAAQQETLDVMLSAWWARSHSPDYMANRQYLYEFIPPEQQAAFQAAYGTDPAHTLAMTSNVPPMGVLDAFDVLATGAALAEIAFAYMNGEDRVAENVMAKLATPWYEKIPDVAKAALAVLAGKAGVEMDAIESGTHTPQMLTAVTPAEALLLNSLGYAPVTMGIAQEPIRELLTTTRGDDDRPRAVGFYAKSLVAAMRLDPFITPHLTKAIDAAAYKNPQFGKDWDAIRVTYTLTNFVGLTSFNVTDPLREAEFDARDVKNAMTKKKQAADGKAMQGERASNAREP